MARPIAVTFNGAESSFSFTKVDREKLYGRKERVVVDELGEACVAAALTTDGAAIVPPGGTAHTYLDDAWDSVERSDLRAVDEGGAPLPLIPSTLGAPQALEGPVDPSRVLDHACTAVYELRPEAVAAELSDALDRGGVFEMRFNYRDDYASSPAFLLRSDQGVFLLVASPTGFGLLRRDEIQVAIDDAPDELEELDFGMM
jgi:hypothetical protein